MRRLKTKTKKECVKMIKENNAKIEKTIEQTGFWGLFVKIFGDLAELSKEINEETKNCEVIMA